ncbi:LacI family DNA-binding transcriptional regulator [Vagococcus sp. BWB3-3]|uniref:LacI family DNA-binding transcriptional regulator n=1 Tax=Vagococcus allomyrinae TaxID=2794353 RepID=A0A940SVU7_9ENTE|nr:LacI family DNA-binding transcriptional regulator [Vagococcus allomyrinae]MBP1042675.1 LacI family DNA-binding transcriptional regulator [Vagococcus allomyrinae]
MSNISDVAKKAGLSVATVSRVINNHPYVSEEKRQAVYEAMAELSYQPSSAARQMRGQSTKIIGVIVPRITNPFFSYLVDEIQQIAFQNAFQIMIFQSNESSEKELSFLELLAKKQIDGIIMCAVEQDQEVIQEFTKYGPIVLCNERFDNDQLPTVSLDQVNGAYLGVNYLLEQGYEKIAYATGGQFEEAGKDRDRNKGFNQAMADAKVPIKSEWLFVNCHTISDGRKIAREISKMSDVPEAIFTGSDEVAAGVIVEAQKLGIKVPLELAVLGFDDQPLAELTTPAITTIRQPIQTLGKETFNLMLSLLQERPYQIDGTKLQMSLVIRESA